MKTVFKANPNWWRKPEHNLKEIIFTPIGSDATRVAALLSAKSTSSSRFRSRISRASIPARTPQVLQGPELRTIFLGMDQVRDELLYSNVKGKNPFKDVRVREAFYKAIDVELIKTRVMRGLSTPSALMIAPQLFPLAKDFTRPKLDPDGAKKLLTEAGYPDGFEVTMDCPNDRYVNDAAICQAVVAHAGPHRRQDQPAGAAQGAVFRQGAEARRLPDIVLSCWAGLPATIGLAQRALRHHRLPRRSENPSRGEANLGGYCNKKMDADHRQGAGRSRIPTKRDLLIKERLRDRRKGFRLYPAASAGTAPGAYRKSCQGGAARRQRRFCPTG